MNKKMKTALQGELAANLKIDGHGPVIYSREEERKRDSVRVQRYIQDNSPVAFGVFIALLLLAPVALIGLVIAAIVNHQWYLLFPAVLGPLWLVWIAFTFAQSGVNDEEIRPYTDRMALERSKLLREWIESKDGHRPLTDGQLNALQDTLGEDRIAAEQTSAQTVA